MKNQHNHMKPWRFKTQEGKIMPACQTGNRVFKKSFWIAFAFYFLIGFEFFYMVSPFAVYFYSVYRPGLDFINSHPGLAWLSTIFLPHLVSHTKSWVLNSIMTAGSIMVLGGMVIFGIGAFQVYYYKLTRKKVVTGGMYNLIRHPQYAGLTVSGLGLLILWPRYIVLLSYITMLFFYYFLARLEEKECKKKFGDRYRKYMKQTKKNKRIDQYKIVFTQSVQSNNTEMTGKKILLNTAGRIPLLEVVIDVPLQKVVQINDPVQGYRLDGVPLPLF